MKVIGFTLLSAISLCFAGCNRSIETESSSIGLLAGAFRAESDADLQRLWATHSLGGQVDIQKQGNLVFVQTFPYSGVRRSHLAVYRADRNLQLECFFVVPTQEKVTLKTAGDGSVEIHADQQRIASLPPTT